MTQADYDVVVIGAGGAGLAAAVSAAETGASVIVLEAAKQVGGSTALAGGSFMVAGTEYQRKLGYEGDSPNEMFEYFMTYNQWRLDPAVIRRFCDEAFDTMEWLRGHGVEFSEAGLYRAGLERAPRSHRAVGGGQAYIDHLAVAAEDLGVDIALDNRADVLIIEDGVVVGVGARGEQLRARAVVLATGGFATNRDLLARYHPTIASAGDLVWSPCPPTNQGDGIALASTANASMTGSNHFDLMLTAGVVKELEPYPPGWLVYINRDGRRFVNEQAPYTIMTAMFREQGGAAWCIFDDASRVAEAADSNAQFGAGTWTADTIAMGVEQGRIARTDDLATLAEKIGVRSRALAITVDRYNADCDAGHDSQFLKDPAAMRPIRTAPFFAVEVRPAVAVVTGYGPRIDPDARVLDADNAPIEGLFAAGEVTGNVLGEQYVGGGNAIGSALIFGRIAGRNAAARRPSQSTPASRLA